MCYLTAAFNLAATPPGAMPSPEGQLKKKTDAATISAVKENPVADELPILRDTPVIYTTQKTPVASPEPVSNLNGIVAADKPKPFIPNTHATATSVKIPSLKDWGKTADTMFIEEEDPYEKGDDKEAFTYDDFLQHWNIYAAKLKTAGKQSVLSIFNTNAPAMLKPNIFEVVVGNKVQENQFRDERPNLLNYLRGTLKNYTIEVNVRVDEQLVVKRPYTNLEKFQHMAAKNPQLAELKNRFNLDFD